MTFWQMIGRSLRQHGQATALAILSMALGVGLLVAVISLREQAHQAFLQEGTGVDAVLGPKGSSLQILLNAVYHLDEMPGKIPWTYYQQVLHDPIVTDGIPFVTGHSYGGFRVNAIDARFFTEFAYRPGLLLSFAPQQGGQGRVFQAPDEAVAGWAAARNLRLHLGDTFCPVCGIHAGDPVHTKNRLRIVGILAPTGTPHDRALYIPLASFYTLEGHGDAVAAMATDLTSRDISGAYLTIKRIRGGALHPGMQELAYNINQSTKAQLVLPTEVLPQLFAIIGWADRVLLAIATLVTLLAILFLFVTLTNALRERRRDLALLRSLGATRRAVCGVILTEALVMAIGSAVLGLLLGHTLVGMGAHIIAQETGLRFSAWHWSIADIILPPTVLLLGGLAGVIPGIQAYRLSVIENLTQVS